MNNQKMLKNSIIEHMESMGLVNDKNCVSKVNIVLSVARKLNMSENQECLIEEAFDNLVREDRIRSNRNKYNENGELVGIATSTYEEKFYLNK